MSEPRISETDRLFLQAVAEFKALHEIWNDQVEQAGEVSYEEGEQVSLAEVLAARQKVITLGSLLPSV